MCLFVHRSRRSRSTVAACKDGSTVRNYDCENCEHYQVDCDFSDTVKYVLETRDFSELPYLVAKKLSLKTVPDILAEIEELKKSWKPKLDPKRLP